MDTPSADAQILRSMQMLQPHTEVRAVPAGAVIFEAGEAGDCLFGVLEGLVSLRWSDQGGEELMGPGRCFGEGALVHSSHARHGTATAQEPTTLLVMNRERFLFAMEVLPLFSVELMASLERRLQSLHHVPAA